MEKNIKAFRRIQKAQTNSDSAIAQFEATIGSLQHSNDELKTLWEDCSAEIERLTQIQLQATQQIDKNSTVIIGLQNLIGE